MYLQLEFKNLKWAKSAASEKHLALPQNCPKDLISAFNFSFWDTADIYYFE